MGDGSSWRRQPGAARRRRREAPLPRSARRASWAASAASRPLRRSCCRSSRASGRRRRARRSSRTSPRWSRASRSRSNGAVAWSGSSTARRRCSTTLPKIDKRLADPSSEVPQQPPYCKNEHRSIKPEYFIAVGICTHLGCSPTYRPEVVAARLGRRLARRLLLPVPPVEVRSRGARVHWRPGADEPCRAAPQVPLRHPDRRRGSAKTASRRNGGRRPWTSSCAGSTTASR